MAPRLSGTFRFRAEGLLQDGDDRENAGDKDALAALADRLRLGVLSTQEGGRDVIEDAPVVANYLQRSITSASTLRPL